MLTVLNVPLLGAIPYLYFYGFGNRWLIAGLVLWLVAGGIAKLIKLPVYKAVAALDAGDVARLEEARRKVNAGNMFQAILNSVAVLLSLVPLVE